MLIPADNRSLWKRTTESFRSSSSETPSKIDVAIVGGGMTGLIAAIELQRDGRSVVLFDKSEIAGGESGNTTAHLTEAIDARYHTLRKDFGKEGAELAASASRDAIDRIESLARELSIDCHFERVDGYLYTERPDEREMLREEADAARDAGVDATWIDRAELPFPNHGAVRFANQAQFHPREFLLGLAKAFEAKGGRIVDSTRVESYSDGTPCTLTVDGRELTADAILLASNSPLNLVAIVTKVAAYRTYAIATKIDRPPIPGALFWDTEDPYHYTRMQRTSDGDFLIVGGEDHKVGTEEETSDCYEKLAEYARKKFGVERVDARWSGQILEPVDGLPYIGRNSGSKNVYIATGYAGQGMTFGAIAGVINADLILGRDNRYAKLFDATRITPIASAVDYVTENIDFPKYLLSDRLSSWDVDAKSFDAVPPGEGMIIESGGRKVAAHRDPSGVLSCFSPVCPHMKCDVRWNDSEKSWDCPCHGSRFDAKGAVLNGPAMHGLEPFELEERK
jgi:glycine/D-amino acid oxidase-like deaminating enzyme/nitrite reductase/ring-hydroxylating ferredoxin subunit